MTAIMYLGSLFPESNYEIISGNKIFENLFRKY